MDNKNADEQTGKNAQEGSENDASHSGIDYEALLLEKDAELEKVRKANKDLTQGIDKWKEKAKNKQSEVDEFGNELPLDLDERIDQRVAERLAQSQEAKLLAEKEEITKQLAKENKELKIAIANRTQISNGTSITSGGNTEVKDNFFSDAQLLALKANAARTGVKEEDYIARAKDNMIKMGMTTMIPPK